MFCFSDAYETYAAQIKNFYLATPSGRVYHIEKGAMHMGQITILTSAESIARSATLTGRPTPTCTFHGQLVKLTVQNRT